MFGSTSAPAPRLSSRSCIAWRWRPDKPMSDDWPSKASAQRCGG
jgi:hypothetical protein